MVHKVRKLLGFFELITGVLVIACGGAVFMDYMQNDTHWNVAIKGPVWIVIGFVFGFMGYTTMKGYDD